jgi:hypothetical protein
MKVRRPHANGQSPFCGDETGVLDARIKESVQIGTLCIDPRHLSLEAEAFMQLPYDASVDLTRAGFDIVQLPHPYGVEDAPG